MHSLFVGINPILLRGHEIKQSFGTPIKLVQASVFRFLGSFPSLVEDGKKENAMMQSTILDRII